MYAPCLLAAPWPLANQRLLVDLPSISINPCFIDSEFLEERVTAVGTVCTGLANLSAAAAVANRSILALNNDVVAWDEGTANFPGCGCPYPGDRIPLDNYVGNVTGFVGNLSWCGDASAQSELLNPTTTGSINWWNVWMESAIIADVSLEFVLTCLVSHRRPSPAPILLWTASSPLLTLRHACRPTR